MLEISQITDNVWVGSRPQDDSDYQYIAALGIQMVVDLTSDISWDVSDNGQRWAQLGLIYKHLPIIDTFPPSYQNVHVLETEIFPLTKTGFATYIHCRLGHGRSPTVAILYLIMAGRYNVDEAISRVQNVHGDTELTYEQLEFLDKFKTYGEDEDEEADAEDRQYMREWTKDDVKKAAEKKAKYIK